MVSFVIKGRQLW